MSEAFRPRVGVILGSGLGAVADAVQDPKIIGYEQLPGFPLPTVAGHAGRVVQGNDRRCPGSRPAGTRAPV